MLYNVIQQETVIGTKTDVQTFTGKKYPRAKALSIAGNNAMETLIDTYDYLVFKKVSDFYADGMKKVTYFTFMTDETYKAILEQEESENVFE